MPEEKLNWRRENWNFLADSWFWANFEDKWLQNISFFCLMRQWKLFFWLIMEWKDRVTFVEIHFDAVIQQILVFKIVSICLEL